MELSLCMIVRNEEENLPRCLESVLEAMDEIIIVDTGSTDRTKEIALHYTEHVYDFVWQDDFSLARNEAFAHATKSLMMWLDADDVMEPEAVQKLILLKNTLMEDVSAVMMPYHCGIQPDGVPTLVFERERIIRRDSGLCFSGFVHEAIALSGKVIHADIPVIHRGSAKQKNPRRNLELYEKHIQNGYVLSPRDQYYYARELKDCGDFERAQQAFSVFLGMKGWLPNRIDAHVQRGHCLEVLGRQMEARVEFLASMAYGVPCAQALCAMGASMLACGHLHAAIFWYKAAMNAGEELSGGAFTLPDMSTYVPAMQLCVCYDRLGMKKEAKEMNDLALKYHPKDANAVQNKGYFSGTI